LRRVQWVSWIENLDERKMGQGGKEGNKLIRYKRE
jgi:hypothetical protein